MTTIRKTADGRWSFVVDQGTDPATGKRRQARRKFDTQKAAKIALAEITANKVTTGGRAPARTVPTYRQVAERWLAAKADDVRPVTLSGYRAALAHSLGTFGAKKITDVDGDDVRMMFRKIDDAGRSRRTISLARHVTKAVLDLAVADGMLTGNVVDRVKVGNQLGRPEQRRSALTSTQYDRLRIFSVQSPDAVAWLLALNGLRRSESLGLTWSDVNLHQRTLTIRRSVTADGTTGARNEATAPKSVNGRRVLELPDDVYAALRSERERQFRFGSEQVRTGYVLVDALGVPLRPEVLSDRWLRLCDAAGVPALTLHAARHSSASLMIERGVRPEVVAAWHGDAVETIMRVYVHVSVTSLAAAGAVLAPPAATAVSS